MNLLFQTKKLLRTIKPIDNCIELKGKDWLYPLEILPIVVLIQKNKLKYRLPENPKCRGYLEYLKFPEGLSSYSKKSDKYIPIYNFDATSKNIDAILTRSKIIDNLIELFIKNIGIYSGIKDGLQLSITEIISNIEEHSYSKKGWIHAQYYPTKEYLDICIVDTGITIKGSYDRHKMDVKSDVGAVIKALKGFSVKKETTRGAEIRTFISMTTKGFKGEAIIISGKALVYATDKAIVPYRSDTGWDGTIIGLRIPRQKRNIEYSKYISY